MDLFSRTASLFVDVDDIDTDNEDDALDEVAIGWHDEDGGQAISEADIDADSLPVSNMDSDDEEEDDGGFYNAVEDDKGDGGMLSEQEDEYEDEGEEEEEEAASDDDADDDTGEVDAEATSSNTITSAGPARKRQKTTKTERFHHVVAPVGGTLVYFSVDVETTGSSRKKHGICKIASAAVSSTGEILGTFERLVCQTHTFTKRSKLVHGIREKDVAGEPEFNVIGSAFNDWIEEFTGPGDCAVLVAHNGNTCDYQYLCCEYQRHNLSFPSQVKYTIDTKTALDKFKGKLGFHKLGEEEWPHRTPKGNASFTCSGVVDYLLMNPHRIKLHGNVNGRAFDAGDGSLRFAQVCGNPHDPLADAIGGAIILFDADGIRKASESNNTPYAELLSVMWDRMVLKMAQPDIIHEKVSSPWEEFPDGEEPPVVVNSTDHRPKDGLMPGPSDALKLHLSQVLNESVRTIGPELVTVLSTHETTVASLAFAIFLFFFTEVLLLHISTCTNAYAKQQWVKVRNPSNGKFYQGPPRNPSERTRARCKCNNWKHLSIAELGVWIGIVIKMGVVSYKTVSHYWIKDRSGFGCSTIYSAMKQRRFEEIYANLSFMMPGSEEYQGDRLRKIRWVNDYLLGRAQLAWNPEQDASIDESMIPTNSKYCPFRQTMKSKPIKSGIKVFCLVYSKSTYLYNWDIFLGANSTSEGSFVYNLVYLTLLLTAFDNTEMRVFMDNFFTSPGLFRDLLRRGIYCVGPTKATRPTKEGNRHEDSWCFQSYSKSDIWKVGGKGWMRHAIQRVATGGAILATVWCDNRFLCMLSTVYILKTDDAQTVLRWTRSKMKR